MKINTSETPESSVKSREAAKSCLVRRFSDFLEEVSESVLIEIANRIDDAEIFNALLVSVKPESTNNLSVSVRNQIALAKSKNLSFEVVKSAYELLEASTVCKILGVSRQGLSKQGAQGKVLAYTHLGRKYYPSFQFENNKVAPEVIKLVKEISIDAKDASAINMLIGFLAQDMDFSNYDESENVRPRYDFLVNESAFEIIVRDFKNRLSMGR